jgi:chromosomal replication initiation ATPase DnaA
LRGRGLSFPQIGRALNRDHSTIQYACRRIEALLASGDSETCRLCLVLMECRT